MYKKALVLFERTKGQDLASHRAFVFMFLFLLSVVSGCGHPQMRTSSDGNYTAEQNIRRGIVEAAKKNIGSKYKFGGTTPQTGFDCSGLILWSYLQYGIQIPRTTWEQMKAGQAVKEESLEPSDILVFKMRRRGRTRYHTGLYAGEGKFIHSPRTGKKIHISSLTEYWKKRLVSARRIPIVK